MSHNDRLNLIASIATRMQSKDDSVAVECYCVYEFADLVEVAHEVEEPIN